MAEKIVILALTGESACFAHALLNALDMQNRGIEVKMVIEGAATRLIKELADPAKPFAPLYAKVVQANLIDCVCRACCKMLGSLEAAEAQKLPLCDEMSGHPSLGRYVLDGYRIISF